MLLVFALGFGFGFAFAYGFVFGFGFFGGGFLFGFDFLLQLHLNHLLYKLVCALAESIRQLLPYHFLHILRCYPIHWLFPLRDLLTLRQLIWLLLIEYWLLLLRDLPLRDLLLTFQRLLHLRVLLLTLILS